MLRSVKYGIYAAVLAGLVAVPAIWTSMDKSVHLVVDGKARTVRTDADRVGDVVRAAGYRVTGHDLLAPSAASTVHNGEHIVLRRGRLLHLTVDGRNTAVWTTATTVQEALDQLGYQMSDFVSVSRSQRLPLRPTDIVIRQPQSVLVVHDGKRQQVTTTAATVGQLLADLGVAVGTHDRVSAPLNSTLVGRSTVVVLRVHNQLLTRTVQIPYRTTKKADGSLYRGTTEIVRSGRTGAARETDLLIYVDGKLAAKSVVARRVVQAPRDQVVAVGTMRIDPSTPAGAKAIAQLLLAKRGWSDQYDCLVSMWNRESGWNIHAANPSGAYGIPQALPGGKMSAAGPDWENDAETQIKWGLDYIAARYNTPCDAWGLWQQQGWY